MAIDRGQTALQINLYRLHVFHAVARHSSFSRAAEELYTSQPNVSRHIAKLEAELGVQVFHRPGTRVALTDAGLLVFEYAQRMFELTEEVRRALDELEGLERGYLRLGASSTPGLYLLPQAVAGFQQRYPGLQVSLDMSNTQTVVERLLANMLDLGFVEAEVTAPGLQVQPWAADELILIAPPGHRLAEHTALSLEALGAETLVVREVGSGTRQVMEAALASGGVRPARVLVMAGCEAVKRAVAAGLGVSFVSRLAVDLEVSQGLLTILAGPGVRLRRGLYIVAHKDVRPSAAALAFLAHLRKSSPTEPS